MASFKGFVNSLQIRDDGWVEFIVQEVHAGNTTRTFFISNLDGDITTAHKRLAHLSLLRDALLRVLPVSVEYRTDPEQGEVVEDITVYPRPSIAGRQRSNRIEGTVIGLAIFERGPESGTTPYVDEADLAGVTLLQDDGSIEQLLLDLQRPDLNTAHAMLSLLREAFRTRRPVALFISGDPRFDEPNPRNRRGTADEGKTPSVKTLPKGAATYQQPTGFIQACEWITVPEETLEYLYAFIERLGQRYESYDGSEAPLLSNVKVLYTTAPSQTPEGDVSDNGTFVPVTSKAFVHGDSPLLQRLEAALRDSLQVKLGLDEDQVHEVEMVSHLGSAARPIWIQVNQAVLPPSEDAKACRNDPTIQSPTASDFDAMPLSVSWRGDAYFNEGIWRFVINSDAECKLLIDGASPCCESSPKSQHMMQEQSYIREYRLRASCVCHIYLEGMHQVEIVLSGRRCEQPFQLNAYRIR
jgi:hypothetical protein